MQYVVAGAQHSSRSGISNGNQHSLSKLERLVASKPPETALSKSHTSMAATTNIQVQSPSLGNLTATNVKSTSLFAAASTVVFEGELKKAAYLGLNLVVQRPNSPGARHHG